MKLSAISSDRRDIDVAFGEGEDAPKVHVAYDPMRYTVAFEQEIEEISKQQFQSIALVKAAANLLVEWDLEDENNVPIPITEEALKKVPIGVLNKIFFAIRDQARPTSEEGKDSGGGSQLGATSESSLSGTA